MTEPDSPLNFRIQDFGQPSRLCSSSDSLLKNVVQQREQRMYIKPLSIFYLLLSDFRDLK